MALADLTLGRFYEARSLVHRLDPRVKLFIALLAMGACIFARNATSFLLLYLLLASSVALSRVPVRYALANLKFFVWLLLIAVILNLFFTGGAPALEYGVLEITTEGVAAAGIAAARLVFIVVAASLLTLTTPPLDLTEGISRLFGFLRVFRLPVRELGMMTGLSLSYLPVLVDEVRYISMAQTSRGANLSGRGFGILKSAVSLLVPVMLSALRRADRLALAMESRRFRTEGCRTSLAAAQMGLADVLALAGAGLVISIALLV